MAYLEIWEAYSETQKNFSIQIPQNFTKRFIFLFVLNVFGIISTGVSRQLLTVLLHQVF